MSVTVRNVATVQFYRDPQSVATVGLPSSNQLALQRPLRLLRSRLHDSTCLAQRALHSPWGRMMRAIRDNEVAAEAMGKNVTGRHLQIFILGSAICGIAGAMMTTLDSQLTPGTYQPLRYTFLIWVMVIIGGSGNNLGAVLGGFIIWFLWVQVEPIGQFLMVILTSGLADDNSLKLHLMDSVAHMRLLTMGLLLLLVLRFSPRGLIPEK